MESLYEEDAQHERFKAAKLSRIKQALLYYAQGLTWFNLYDVYECVRKDLQELENRAIPDHWLTDASGRNRLMDFRQSANNAYISGYAARHTYAESSEIDRISDKLVRLKGTGEEIVTMTLSEAEAFIENLLVQWLKYRGIRF